MTAFSSPDRSVVWLRAEAPEGPGVPPLTVRPGGTAAMALAGTVLYLRPRVGVPLTACDHDRAAALGHPLEGEPQGWPLAGGPAGKRGTSSARRREVLRLDLPALLPGYACRVQAGPPELPLLIEASGPQGQVTVGVTAATNRRHRSAATLASDVARTIRQALPDTCLQL